jgi:ceramide glucosyltransferase
MFKFVLGLGLFGLLTSTIYAGMVVTGAFAYLRSRRKNKLNPDYTPPVSLLKPLHGMEPNLEAHLESFFEQDYPCYEILFCARQADDKGLLMAQRVAARHPNIPVRFLTTGEPRYINAKVHSLERMQVAASHDIFIISDSDVRVTPNYIREVVAPFEEEKVGAVTCPYRGVAAGEGLWAMLEAVGMSIEMTSGVLVARMLEGMQFTLGPTMAARRECVERMGGFSLLGSYCADDFVLGNAIYEQGRTVILSDHVIDHMVINMSFMDSIRHQVRWMKSTRFSRPKGHFGTSLTFSVPFGILATVGAAGLGSPELAAVLLGFSVGTRILMGLIVGGGVLEDPDLLRTTLLYPLRDAMGFGFWAASYLSNKVVWRGEVYALAPGGLMRSLSNKAESKRTEPALTA